MFVPLDRAATGLGNGHLPDGLLAGFLMLSASASGECQATA
ncbi:hypothetical protein AIOL_003160 [Candidatus Rhodobacter oscarellae]|uniref:Uncharacterized protein n=1 Tax=Candidatus Rhodobacter oscarellae TaxID=1675527 RepID=A0A0J9E947_9RHOB|nr:hypothetical protein AIOL_003160 [Candidatus Rhodobacter lobularis]